MSNQPQAKTWPLIVLILIFLGVVIFAIYSFLNEAIIAKEQSVLNWVLASVLGAAVGCISGALDFEKNSIKSSTLQKIDTAQVVYFIYRLTIGTAFGVAAAYIVSSQLPFISEASGFNTTKTGLPLVSAFVIAYLFDIARLIKS